MRSRISIRLGAVCVLGAAAACCTGFGAVAAQSNFNEREVKSQPSTLDKFDVWTMDVRFKDPRIIKIKWPGRGERIVWYMWYQVINRSGKPRDISPVFELVTLDTPGLYRDEVGVTAEEAIRKIEDPKGYQDIKNFVTISKFAIPVSKPPDEAFPRAVTGVAIWDAGPADPKKRDPKHRELAESTRFSIFVRGLSSGYVEVDAPAPGLPAISQAKTLQLNFKRKGDRFSTDSRDIEFVPPAQWIYRAASRKLDVPEKGDDKK